MINRDFPVYNKLSSAVDDGLVIRYSPDRLCSMLRSILDHADVDTKKYISTSIELIILHHARLSLSTEVVPYGGIQRDLSVERDIDRLPTDLQLVLFAYAEECSS